jgi:hypothetical protein
LSEVEEIETIHNPIRAWFVNGVDVEDVHYHPERAAGILTSVEVTVPYVDILAMIRESTPDPGGQP